MAKKSGKEQYAIFVDGEPTGEEANSLAGIIKTNLDAPERAEIARNVRGAWHTTHVRKGGVWEAVDPKGETVEEFEARQDMPDKIAKAEAPPWEPDLFAGLDEVDDPALTYVINRWSEHGQPVEDGPNAAVVIEGRVEEAKFWTKVRRGSVLPEGQGGDKFDSDEQHGQLHWAGNLKCDLVVRKPLAAILGDDGDLGVVREVFRQLGDVVEQETYRLMVRHVETIYAEKDGKVQAAKRGGVDMGKEVRPTKKTTGTEL